MPLVKISTTKPTASQDILPTTDTIPFIPVPKASSKSPPIPITAQASTSTPETSVPPPPQLPSPTIESPTAASPFPAGQTVDDLLMSIIGVTPAAPPQPPTAPIGQPSPRFPFQPAAPPAARPAPLASPEAAPPAPPHPETNSNIRSRPSKVRDATFAQAAANSSSSPLDDTMFVPLPADPPTQSMPSSSTSFPTPSIGPVLRFPASRSTPSRAVPPGTGRAPKASMLHQVNGNSTQTPRTAMISATTDTVASHSNGFSHRILGGPNEKLQKKEFVQSLLELIHVSGIFPADIG